jgi:hypothetical protein
MKGDANPGCSAFGKICWERKKYTVVATGWIKNG